MALFINGVGQDTFNMNGVSIDNLYVDGVLVWTGIPEVANIPRYEFTEALVDASTIDDSNNTLDTYNGKLTESDGTTPYNPTALQYPQNGLLELASGRIMNTQFNPVPNKTAMYGIYGADGSTVYKIWAVEHLTLMIYNVYEGDQDTPLTLTFTASINIPDESMKITDERPSWLPAVAFAPVHISFRNNDTIIDPMPDGASINTVYRNYGGGTMVDTNGDASDIYTTWDVGMQAAIANTNSSTSDDSGCIYDFQMNQATNTTVTATLDIYLPSGTYTVRALSSYTNANPYDGLYTLGTYGEQAMNGNTAGVANETCIEWTDVVGSDGLVRLTIVNNGGSSYGALLNGLDIIRTA